MDIIHATFVGALSGVLGTGAGGLLILLVNFGAGAGLSFLLAASGGIMISISLMELIPEAVEVGSKGWAALGLLLGVIILFVLDMVLPHAHSSFVVRAKSGVYHGERAARLRSAGLLIGLGIALHNLPEGATVQLSPSTILGSWSRPYNCASQHPGRDGYGSPTESRRDGQRQRGFVHHASGPAFRRGCFSRSMGRPGISDRLVRLPRFCRRSHDVCGKR